MHNKFCCCCFGKKRKGYVKIKDMQSNPKFTDCVSSLKAINFYNKIKITPQTLNKHCENLQKFLQWKVNGLIANKSGVRVSFEISKKPLNWIYFRVSDKKTANSLIEYLNLLFKKRHQDNDFEIKPKYGRAYPCKDWTVLRCDVSRIVLGLKYLVAAYHYERNLDCSYTLNSIDFDELQNRK